MFSVSTGGAAARFLASRGGSVSWRDWMEAALYDPERGYYTAQIRAVGRGGDFATTATLDAALGGGIARWIQEQWRAHGRRLPIIEVGPGSGQLHARIYAELPWQERWGLRTHLVERSPILAKTQRELLASRALWATRRHQWHTTMEAALAACGGQALIVSNELADAFPAHRLRWDGQQWSEVYLRLAAVEAGHTTLTCAYQPVPTEWEFSAKHQPWPAGQHIEVLESWHSWLRAWLPHWQAGTMLTIDYGGAPAEIYHRRPHGTVRGFLHHQRLEEAALYAHMGRCDVTVDVNFTDLQQWGEALGLTTLTLESQDEFVRSRVATASLLYAPQDAASAFRCLSQRR